MLVKGSQNKRIGIMLNYDELQERQMTLELNMATSENWEEENA